MRILTAMCLFFITLVDAQAEWQVSESVDKFTDEKIVVALEQADEKGTLIVRCKKGDVEMYVDVDEYLSNQGIDFRYRIDRDPMVEDRGPASTTGKAVFFNFAASRARAFMAGNSVLFEVFDFRGVGHTRKFSLSGSAAAIGAVLGACGIREVAPEGVDGDIVEGVDEWSKGFTLLAKEALKDAGRYSGTVDSSKPDELYQVIQILKPGYVRHCASNRLNSECMSVRLSRDDRVSTYDIVEWAASPDLRKKINDYFLRR